MIIWALRFSSGRHSPPGATFSGRRLHDASFGETHEGVTAFAKKKGLTLPIALSADGSAADVFGVNSTTTTVVIDREGKLQYFGQFGDRDHDYAKDALNAVLAGKDVPVQRTRPKG